MLSGLDLLSKLRFGKTALLLALGSSIATGGAAAGYAVYKFIHGLVSDPVSSIIGTISAPSSTLRQRKPTVEVEELPPPPYRVIRPPLPILPPGARSDYRRDSIDRN